MLLIFEFDNEDNKKFEMREFNYGCGVVTQNFLLNYYSFFQKSLQSLVGRFNFHRKNKKICSTTVVGFTIALSVKRNLKNNHYSRGTEPSFC